MPGERLVRITEAAEHYGLHYNTIYGWIMDGRIAGHRFGPKIIMVDLDELDRLRVPIKL
jgi:excisionase family DNA binding protein